MFAFVLFALCELECLVVAFLGLFTWLILHPVISRLGMFILSERFLLEVSKLRSESKSLIAKLKSDLPLGVSP